MNNVLKKLSGNELKVLFVILYNCDAEHSYSPIESLTEFEITYPTILKIVDILKKKKIIEQFDAGNKCILKLNQRYFSFSDYLKNYSFQIELVGESLEDIQRKREEAIKQKDAIRLIYYYGAKQGVRKEKLQDWFKLNLPRLMKPAKQILAYVKEVDKAFILVDNTKIYYESRNLDWSMQGVMLREIDKLSNLNLENKEGGKNWF